jgi:hypothetical protein
MEAIKQILAALDYESPLDLDINESITIESEVFMDLTIERVARTRVSVAHHYTQRGDLMSDPEIVFDVDGDEWTAIQKTVHPHEFRHCDDGLPGVQRFAGGMWNSNLERQGFVETAKEMEV